MTVTILLAEDDRSVRTVLEQAIQRNGMNVLAADNASKVWKWVEQGKGDIVVTDVMMQGENGFDLLKKIKSSRPSLPVIVISARNNLLTAIRANEFGAFEYLAKPFDLPDFLDCIKRSLAKAIPEQDNSSRSDSLPIVGSSQPMQELYKLISKILRLDVPVLISGATGSGKSLVAKVIHDFGNMDAAPFTRLSGAEAIETMESNNISGTVYIDEVADLPADAQKKLVDLIHLHDSQKSSSRVRLIFSSSKDLLKLVKDGQFRDDLYYLIKVVELKIPSLNDRKEDIPELVNFFLIANVEKGFPEKKLDESAMNELASYDWPGNVRELENIIYRVSALHSHNIIDSKVIHQEISSSESQVDNAEGGSNSLEKATRLHVRNIFSSFPTGKLPCGLYHKVIHVVEKPLIEATLAIVNGNQLKAAEILGINRNTLRKKISELDIDVKMIQQIKG